MAQAIWGLQLWIRSVVLNLFRDMTVLRVLLSLIGTGVAWTETSVPEIGKAIIGYWGSASDLPKESQLAEALQRGYNVIAVAFGDTLGADGSFQIHTNLGAPPTKSEISRTAGVSGDSWQYILSFGGQNAAGPYVTDVDGYVSGFMKTYEAAQEQYGFDGIDIDIETGMGTQLLKALRQIFQQLHAKNQVISMAPQPLNIDPAEVSVFMEGAYNCYVPLVDTTIIDSVTYVAVQLYNNAMPLGDLEKYIASMQAGTTIQWNGESLKLDIPSSKLVFGFPSAPGAAPSGPAESWELPASSLASHYRSSPTLMATGGCMTWSIGWDASQEWAWVKAVKELWSASQSVLV
uniref:chitinase n=1 Tax=Noctiluca scintillans TaxID=2966 RepID=A0A7S0ZRP6_NOCSC